MRVVSSAVMVVPMVGFLALQYGAIGVVMEIISQGTIPRLWGEARASSFICDCIWLTCSRRDLHCLYCPCARGNGRPDDCHRYRYRSCGRPSSGVHVHADNPILRLLYVVFGCQFVVGIHCGVVDGVSAITRYMYEVGNTGIVAVPSPTIRGNWILWSVPWIAFTFVGEWLRPVALCCR